MLTLQGIEKTIERKNDIKEMIELINRADVIEYLYIIVSDVIKDLSLEE